MKTLKHTVVALVVVLMTGCGGGGQSTTPPPGSNPPPASSVPLSFPYTDGWLGADSAYSISLGSGKSVWLFGDTYAGNSTDTQRSQAKALVRNSVGISQCDTSTCTMHYYWSGQGTATPRAFFDTGGSTWYWPMDGFVSNGVLYIAMMEMHATGSGVFGFDYSGTKLMTINNPSSAPSQWNVHVQSMSTGNQVVPGVSIVVESGYANFFTLIPSGSSSPSIMTLARVSTANLASVTSSFEYLGTDGQWHAGLYAADAKTVIDNASTEMTIRYHALRNEWIAVATDPNVFAGRVVIRTATSFQGPWSAATTLYQYPEMQSGMTGYDVDNFCYAAKEHTEFLSDAKIVMTYACNSYSLTKLSSNMGIYRPQVVVLDAP